MKILVITRRKAERDRLHQEDLVQQALKQLDEADAAWRNTWLPIAEAARKGKEGLRRVADLADEYAVLAERTDNEDLTALVVQLRAVLELLAAGGADSSRTPLVVIEAEHERPDGAL